MSTLALVEPISPKAILNCPPLGCAMLVASCRRQGIRTVVVKGQTSFLQEMFVRDQAGLWGLINDLRESDLDKIGISGYRQEIRKNGLPFFRKELKDLYWYFFRQKNLRSYCDTSSINKFVNLYVIFMAVLAYYIEQTGCDELGLIDNYLREITKANPDYIGFSLDEPEPFSFVIRKRLKERTRIPMIIGGSFTPFLGAGQIKGVLKNEFADYLVIGPGELALPALIKRLDAGKSPAGVPNVFYKEKSRIKENPLKEVVDLDSLAYPDFSQCDLDGYLSPQRLLPLQTARGCSWKKCAFCDYHRNTFGTLRMFSIKKTAENIAYLKDRYQCRNFTFHDDDFPPARARQLSREIISRKIKGANFYQFARFDRGFDDSHTLRLMRRAGFALIKWGMESGSQRVLDLMEKGTRVEITSRILKKSHHAGILNHCMVFFGFPGETRKEAWKTVGFLKDHAEYIDSVEFKPFALSAYSRVATDPRKFGVVVKKDNGYTLQKGLSQREAGDFTQALRQRVDLGTLRIANNRLGVIGDQKGYQHFLLQILLKKKGVSLLDSSGYLGRDNPGGIYPLALGSLKLNRGVAIYLPQDITSSLFINMLRPPEKIILDKLQEHVVGLSNGNHALREIIRSAPAGRGRAEKITGFLNELLRHNFALMLTGDSHGGKRRA